ncbi:hypothetical protein LTR17_027855, partial [Elasticomyces elasticus]
MWAAPSEPASAVSSLSGPYVIEIAQHTDDQHDDVRRKAQHEESGHENLNHGQVLRGNCVQEQTKSGKCEYQTPYLVRLGVEVLVCDQKRCLGHLAPLWVTNALTHDHLQKTTFCRHEVRMTTATILQRAQTLPMTNRNGQVVIVTVTFTLVIAILCLITRLVMRWPWRKMMSRNDYFALGATTFALRNAAAALCVAVRNGLGEEAKKPSSAHTSTLRKSVLVAHLFYYLCASFAIASVAKFLFQIKATKRVLPLDVLR